MRSDMSTKETSSVPFQLQQVIDGMLNKKDNVYLRSNYRMRLESIRGEIEKAIRKYDNELQFTDATKGKKKRA